MVEVVVGWGWKFLPRKVLWLFILLEPSQSRVCHGERPSWNTSASPTAQLSVTAPITGSSSRAAQLARGKLCTSKPHRLSLLTTKGESPSLAQQHKTGMIFSPAFVSCSWQRRRTEFLVNHVLAVVTQCWPCVLCPGMREQCWHPLKAAHLNRSLWDRGPPHLPIRARYIDLCKSLSTLTLPTSGPLWLSQAGAMVKSFLKHFLQISLTTLQPPPQPTELLPEIHVCIFAHIGKLSKFSGTAPLHCSTYIQRVGRRPITESFFFGLIS